MVLTTQYISLPVDVTVIFDKACRSFERGEHRKAFMLFDICVIIRPFDTQFRLSRGICAHSLCVYTQTLEDAYKVLELKKNERNDANLEEVRKGLSGKLRNSLAQKDDRDLARAQFWLGKAHYELGDVQKAHFHLCESQSLRRSPKSDAMVAQCHMLSERANVLLLHRQAARVALRTLFCDQDRWLDGDDGGKKSAGGESAGGMTRRRALPFNATLQHPHDSQLPETLTGTLGVFYRAPYEAERDRLMRCIRAGGSSDYKKMTSAQSR